MELEEQNHKMRQKNEELESKLLNLTSVEVENIKSIDDILNFPMIIPSKVRTFDKLASTDSETSDKNLFSNSTDNSMDYKNYRDNINIIKDAELDWENILLNDNLEVKVEKQCVREYFDIDGLCESMKRKAQCSSIANKTD